MKWEKMHKYFIMRLKSAISHSFCKWGVAGFNFFEKECNLVRFLLFYNPFFHIIKEKTNKAALYYTMVGNPYQNLLLDQQ